jgi:L-ribulose-5-phosphate 3-epimerase
MQELGLLTETVLPLSLCQWSLHRHLLGARLKPLARAARALRGKFGMAEPLRGELDPLDFPLVARRAFGFSAVEYTGFFYADRVRDGSYLRELKRRCDGEGVKNLLIACSPEGEIGLGHPNAAQRRKIVNRHLRWMDMAAFLGCHAISVRLGSVGDAEEQAALNADGLHRLAEWGQAHHLDVLVENHDGHSADGAWLSGVLKRADHPRVGAAPDWGNFAGDSAERERSLAHLMPFARALTAKSVGAKGEVAETARLLRIVRAAGYSGHVGVEYEGDRMSEADGVQAAKKVLEGLLRRDTLRAAPANT